MADKQYAYSEIFHSVQGEGKYTGVPSGWLRFFLCNLQCNGFMQKDPTDESTYKLPYKEVAKELKENPDKYPTMESLPVFEYGCDSSYSWFAGFKKLQRRGTATEIADRIKDSMKTESNPEGYFAHPSGLRQHMCFTGGEPLMPHAQQATVEILKAFRNQPGGPVAGMTFGLKGSNYGSNMPKSVTFETNGTQPLTSDFIDYFENRGNFDEELFFSVSPKLFTVSGETKDKAIQPNVLKTYRMLSKHGQLKFVMGKEPRQWEEMEDVLSDLRAVGIDWPVYIMPVGALAEQQEDIAGDVAQLAFQRGYNVSARMHCYLWGNLIGV